MKTRYILILIAGLLGFWSCIDDEGNYKYIELPGLTINKGTMASLQAIVGEPVTYDPKVEYEVPADSVYFTYIWYDGKDSVSNKKILEFTPLQIREYRFRLEATDTRTGVQYVGTLLLSGVSPYQDCFVVLYKEGETSRLGFVKVQGFMEFGDPKDFKDYKIYYHVYKDVNGTDLGTGPQKVIQHIAGMNKSEFLVIQKGGDGCVEVDGTTVERVIATKQEFVNENPPANLAPVDVCYHPSINVLLNADGKLYNREMLSNEGFHSNAYVNVPMYIDVDNGVKGGKIERLIQPIYTNTNNFLLHDETNRRLIYSACFGSNLAAMVVLFCEDGWPAENYTPLDNLGDMELTYVAAYGDYKWDGGSSKYVMILKDPSGKYKIQQFGVPARSSGGVTIEEAYLQKDFSGGEYITPNSKFFLYKTGEYLFFSGGANNDLLCCYRMVDGETFVHDNFNGKSVTALCPNEGYTYSMWSGYPGLGVGLSNGEFYFYHMTDAALYYNKPEVLYRCSGFGDGIVDVIYKHTSEFTFWQ